jgi:imidazolonepropionase
VTTTLLTNIAELTTHAAPDLTPFADATPLAGGLLADAPLTDAALVIADGRVAWTGPAAR